VRDLLRDSHHRADIEDMFDGSLSRQRGDLVEEVGYARIFFAIIQRRRC
jgi:hypothetical protein